MPRGLLTVSGRPASGVGQHAYEALGRGGGAAHEPAMGPEHEPTTSGVARNVDVWGSVKIAYSTSVTISVLVRKSTTTSPREERKRLRIGASSAARA